MGKETSIAWADCTFNPWIGCAKVSAGCRNCYAEHGTPVRVHRGRGLELWDENAARHVTSVDYWRQPRRWNSEAEATGVRARVFCASLADIFEVHPAVIEARGNLFKLIELTPWLDWLLLTKRPGNMVILAPDAWAERWPSNVWAGTTVEDQAHVDERIPHLLKAPARARFLSVEPMLESVTLSPGIHWVICGGESGTKARRFDLAWARSLRDRCREAGVPFFMKQLGAQPCGEARPPTDGSIVAREAFFRAGGRGTRQGRTRRSGPTI